MKGFKEYFDTNPPAIIAQAENPLAEELSQLSKAVVLARNYLLNLVETIIKESWQSNRLYADIVDNVIGSDEYKNYIKQNFGDIKPQETFFGYKKSCGEDSCAIYYTDDYIVKFLGGRGAYREFKIAQAVAGQLSMFPIIDAVEFDHETTGEAYYCVVMKTLITDHNKMSSYIREAADLVGGTVHNLQYEVEKNPNLSIKYIKEKLTVKEMLKGYMDVTPEIKKATKDLVKIIKTVYEKSGYLVGADIQHGRNIGFTEKGKIMIYDYGRPDEHPIMKKKIKEKPIEPINIKTQPNE